MPRIELVNVPLYSPNDPYFWEVDNLPFNSLIERMNIINMTLDNVVLQMSNAIGTQGSVANRLNQSIENDGSLKTDAINEAMHDIESHADTDDYVRMTANQSSKLDLIDDLATSLYFKIEGEDDEIEFRHGALTLIPSSTITFTIGNNQELSFDMAFPPDAAHRHFYDITPVPTNLVTPDYINYFVSSSETPFINGTLRVYINGVRINANSPVYVPGFMISDPWTLLSYTADPENGSFALSASISDDDVILIDYDILLT